MLNPWLAVAGTIVAMLITLIATPYVARFAQRIGAIDIPDARKVHAVPIPRLGGVAVILGVLGGFLVLGGPERAADFGPYALLAFFGGGALVFTIGAIDDRFRLRAPIKLAVQLAAAGLAYACGIQFTEITVPWTGESVPLGVVALPATIFWIVFVTNAWNLIDGMDGLAATLGFIAAVVFALMLVARQLDSSLVLVIPLIGALLGFLPYNLNPARIFLGDSGSYLIGYKLALVSIITGQKGVTSVAVFGPLLIVGLPVLDAMSAVIRRLLRPGPLPLRERFTGVFQADRGHVHHRAMARGWSQRRALIVLALTGAAMGTLGIVSTFVRSPRLGGMLLLVGFVLFLLLYFGSAAGMVKADPDRGPDSPQE